MKILCEYRTFNGDYTCFVKSASITEMNAKIESFKGEHDAGKTDNDVVTIWFRYTTVEYFPRHLQMKFPNLKDVTINFCGLKKITRKDLIGLEDLITLNLNDNKIRLLPDDLFDDMPNLTTVEINHNHIEYASSKLLEVFDKESSLEFFELYGNNGINIYYNSDKNNLFSISSIRQLKEIIDDKCKPPCERKPKIKTQKNQANGSCSYSVVTTAPEMPDQLFLQGFNSLRKLSQLTDLAIVVGFGSKEFLVHKTCLAIQSPVFARMFGASAIESSKLEISNVGVGAVADFLDYLYERKQPEVKNALGVFKLAAQFDITKLKASCEQIIRENIEKTDAMKVFDLAREFNLDDLKISAFKQIQEFFGCNLSDKLLNDPDELHRIVNLKRNLDDALNRHKRIKLEEISSDWSFLHTRIIFENIYFNLCNLLYD